MCLWLCTTSVGLHNTKQNSSDNLPSYLQTNIIAQMLSIRGEGDSSDLISCELSALQLVDDLGRALGCDPVRRGCDHSQRTQLRWGQTSWGETAWYEHAYCVCTADGRAIPGALLAADDRSCVGGVSPSRRNVRGIWRFVVVRAYEIATVAKSGRACWTRHELRTRPVMKPKNVQSYRPADQRRQRTW